MDILICISLESENLISAYSLKSKEKINNLLVKDNKDPNSFRVLFNIYLDNNHRLFVYEPVLKKILIYDLFKWVNKYSDYSDTFKLPNSLNLYKPFLSSDLNSFIDFSLDSNKFFKYNFKSNSIDYFDIAPRSRHSYENNLIYSFANRYNFTHSLVDENVAMSYNDKSILKIIDMNLNEVVTLNGPVYIDNKFEKYIITDNSYTFAPQHSSLVGFKSNLILANRIYFLFSGTDHHNLNNTIYCLDKYKPSWKFNSKINIRSFGIDEINNQILIKNDQDFNNVIYLYKY